MNLHTKKILHYVIAVYAVRVFFKRSYCFYCCCELTSDSWRASVWLWSLDHPRTRDGGVIVFLFVSNFSSCTQFIGRFFITCFIAMCFIADAKDLIESCLSVEASKRPTLRQVLAHRWTLGVEFPAIDKVLSWWRHRFLRLTARSIVILLLQT